MDFLGNNFLILPFLGYLGGLPSMLLLVCALLLSKLFRYQKILGEDTLVLSKSVILSSMIDEDDSPSGLIVGKWFIGYSCNEKDEKSVTLLITYKSYSSIFVKEVIRHDEPITMFNFYVRRGNFGFLRYFRQTLPLTNLIPTSSQERVIESILNVYEKKRSCVVLLSGPPGSGKSKVAHLLLNKFASIKYIPNFVKTFSLTDPGESIYTLAKTVDSKPTSPLVILLDEIDVTIERIHTGIEQHKNYPIWVTNKASWDSFFDDFDSKLLENIVVVMTTNRSFDYIDNLDPAYTREGRVDIKATI